VIKNLTDEQLKNIIVKMGREMTSASSTRNISMERERRIYIDELFQRGLGGMRSKKKYRNL